MDRLAQLLFSQSLLAQLLCLSLTQRSLSGSSQSPRLPSAQPFLSVSVTDPVKLGNGVQVYISYRVVTKVIAKNLQEEIMGFKEIFRSIDIDNNGTIAYEELKTSLPKYQAFGV